MIDLAGLARGWSVNFAIGLAFLVFVVKLVIHRRLAPLDWLSAVAEMPSDISAACLSLAVAYLWLSSANGRVGSIAFLSLTFAFVVTTAIYRYVDEKKLDFRLKPIRVIAALVASYFVLVIFAISIVGQLYSGVKS